MVSSETVITVTMHHIIVSKFMALCHYCSISCAHPELCDGFHNILKYGKQGRVCWWSQTVLTLLSTYSHLWINRYTSQKWDSSHTC